MRASTFSRPAAAHVAAAALLALAAGTASAAPADAALLAAANAAQPAVIASLKDMVQIESGSADGAGLAKMASHVEARLQSLGARTERTAPAQLNWTMAQAGVVNNQILEKATARADVRTTAPGAADRLRTASQDKVKAGRLVPDTETSVTLEVGRPPYLANDRARALAAQAQAIYAELDGRVLASHPMTGGSTDAGFASRSGRAVVLESFGLAGSGYHVRDEYIEIDSIPPRLYLMTRLLQTVARAP